MPVQDILYRRLGLAELGMQKNVRRCLFGKPDHEELKKDLQIQLKSGVEDIKRRWNFDIESESPLPGLYEWTRMSNEDVPSVYLKQYRPTRVRNIRCSLDLESSTVTDTPPSSPETLSRLQEPTSEDLELEQAEELRKENEATPEAKSSSTRQTTIDEFMKKRKRRRLSDDEDEESSTGKRTRH